MINVSQKNIAKIPVLEIVDAALADKALPLVVFYHGWTNTKEAVMVNGYELAKQGIRAVIPEALYHGERKDDKETEEHGMEFWQIVLNNVQEFPEIVKFYQNAQLVLNEQVGVVGLSMGGITTCGIMAQYPWVKAASCLMGTPAFVRYGHILMEHAKSKGAVMPENAEEVIQQLANWDLTYFPEKIGTRPFHFWHGTQDQTMPYELTHSFYQKHSQKPYGSNMVFTTTDGIHKVPYCISVEMAEFFGNNLMNH